MTAVPFTWFGGRHSEAVALRGLLAHAGVKNPASGEPLSEPLCFGIAGGDWGAVFVLSFGSPLRL